MNEYDWKPGDVAMISTNRGWVRGIWVDRCTANHIPDAPHWHTDQGWATSECRQARPLVVLDPESEDDRRRMRNVAVGYSPGYTSGMSKETHTRWAKRLRSLLTVAAKPEDCDAIVTIAGVEYRCEVAGDHKQHRIADIGVTWS